MGLIVRNQLKRSVPAAPPPRGVLQEGTQTLAAYRTLQPEEFAQAGAGTGLEAGLIEDYGPRLSSAMAGARTPESRRLYDLLNSQASEELQAGSGLSPSMRRELEQYTRAGAASRGFGYGPSDLTSEVMTLGSAGEELKGRRRAFAESVFQLDEPTNQAALGVITGRAPAAHGVFDQYPQDVYDTNYNAAYADRFAALNYNAALTAAVAQVDAALLKASSSWAWVKPLSRRAHFTRDATVFMPCIRVMDPADRQALRASTFPLDLCDVRS